MQRQGLLFSKRLSDGAATVFFFFFFLMKLRACTTFAKENYSL